MDHDKEVDVNYSWVRQILHERKALQACLQCYATLDKINFALLTC